MTVTFNTTDIDHFGFARVVPATEFLPLKAHEIVFDTEREGIEGVYSVEITLTDLA